MSGVPKARGQSPFAEDLRIVLARPRIGENVGFVVRLAANFGLEDLVLVDPLPGWRKGADRTASMCREGLAKLRVVPTLSEALADRQVVLGFTARWGRDRPVRAFTTLGEQMAEAPEKAKIALCFGNEESGLSQREAAFCTDLFLLDLPGSHASLNLSHAVALALYELHRTTHARPAPRGNEARPITVAEKDLLIRRAREVCNATEFRVDPPHFRAALERLVYGTEIQSRDARVLHKALTYMTWLAKKAGLWTDPGPENPSSSP